MPVTEKGLVDFGNPYREQRLPEEGPAPALDVSPRFLQTEHPLDKFLRENVTGQPSPEAAERVHRIEEFTINALLRHIPVEERATILEDAVRFTKIYRTFERPEDNARAEYSHDILFKRRSTTYIGREAPDPAVLIHETIHRLQHQEYLPRNNALTYAAQTLWENLGEKSTSTPAESTIDPRYIENPTSYFELVLSGRAHEAYDNGWILRPQNDGFHPDYYHYLQNEAEANQAFGVRGETIENLPLGEHVIQKPYEVMYNIGVARGERAYMLGKLTGDMDHAWSVLWLHGTGMPFEDAERYVLQSVLNGNSEELYAYQEIRDVESQPDLIPITEENAEINASTEVSLEEAMPPELYRAFTESTENLDALTPRIRNSIEDADLINTRVTHGVMDIEDGPVDVIFFDKQLSNGTRYVVAGDLAEARPYVFPVKVAYIVSAEGKVVDLAAEAGPDTKTVYNLSPITGYWDAKNALFLGDLDMVSDEQGFELGLEAWVHEVGHKKHAELNEAAGNQGYKGSGIKRALSAAFSKFSKRYRAVMGKAERPPLRGVVNTLDVYRDQLVNMERAASGYTHIYFQRKRQEGADFLPGTDGSRWPPSLVRTFGSHELALYGVQSESVSVESIAPEVYNERYSADKRSALTAKVMTRAIGI